MFVFLLKHKLQYFLFFVFFSVNAAGFVVRAEDSPGKNNTVVVSISGQISKNVLAKIKKSIAGVTGDPLPAGLIVLLDSPGGDGMAAMEIGRLLRASNAHVFVTGQCASACIFVLAAGVVRGAASLSVGIHRGRITMSDADAKILSDVDVSKNADAQNTLRSIFLMEKNYFAENYCYYVNSGKADNTSLINQYLLGSATPNSGPITVGGNNDFYFYILPGTLGASGNCTGTNANDYVVYAQSRTDSNLVFSLNQQNIKTGF